MFIGIYNKITMHSILKSCICFEVKKKKKPLEV